ncbi:unnamed protein product [Danaus chrysippus]|uniref:(African queen) hypothetical protein n=1 Tax=Danaus chrysippus TaxID=151541 RepID=A0A8J2QUW0_9NEOP|nr:unnamed protein product [Danaus chrysippus]
MYELGVLQDGKFTLQVENRVESGRSIFTLESGRNFINISSGANNLCRCTPPPPSPSQVPLCLPTSHPTSPSHQSDEEF